jgi:hypothetical protein
MRKLKFALFSVACIFLFSCKPSPEKAIDYSNVIIGEQTKIQTLENDLVSESSEGDAEKMEPALNKFKAQVNESIETVKKMDKFDGKEDFKNATLNFFAVYRSVGENEYTQILEIFRKEYTEADHDKVIALNDQLNKKEKDALAELKKVHEKFAKDYNFQIDK